MTDDLPENQDSVALTIPIVLDLLAHGDIEESHGVLPWGSNYAFLVSVRDGQRSLLAVYKPQQGERPLWDFPEGTLCYREVAAFLVSEALGWSLVPPTVLRDGPHGVGSLQFFVDHDPELTYFSPFPDVYLPQLRYFAAFDAIINNADRKGGHCLLDEQGHLWGIDHGISFHHAPKLRTVIWDYAGEPLPDKMLHDLLGLNAQLSDTDASLTQALAGLLTEREFKALSDRVDALLTSKQYPLPSEGRNYPWPPV